MNDLIALGITVFVIGVLFMLTMVNVLNQYKHKADAAWNELDKQLIIRRDTVPCLLQSARIQDKRWAMLRDMRTELLKNDIPKDKRLDLEIKFGNAIEALLAIARNHEQINKNTSFLEAEKDLRHDTAVDIRAAYDKWEKYSREYDEKISKFPYSNASKIFRLKNA